MSPAGGPKEAAFHRKLAAIVAADVVAYSRLMEADEFGTLKRLQALQRSAVLPTMARHAGRLVKTTGDGFLFEFASAIEAVLFAVELQKAARAQMAAQAEDKRLVLRVGIHAGDVLSDGNDMFGDGVNVAARLETLCEPGGICMSAVVRDQLRNKVELPLVDRGEHVVKNISRPVHAFGIDGEAIDDVPTSDVEGPGAGLLRKTPRAKTWMVAGLLAILVGFAALAVRHATAPGPAATQDLSLAVLPFATRAEDPKQGEFADALADNITTSVSLGVPGLTVIASASTSAYKGRTVDPRQIGRELGVAYLLDGNVDKVGDRLRVRARLISTANAAQLWSDTFDGDISQFADLQDQITAGIAHTLQVQLIRIEAKRRAQMANGSALDLILEGEALLNRPITLENLEKAAGLFREALQRDPGNLTAMTDLATVLAQSLSSLDEAKAVAALDEAKKLLDRVQMEDPRFPAVHNTLGVIDLVMQRPRDAVAQFKIEIANDRNAAAAYSNLGGSLTTIGKPAEAIPLIEKGLRLNPRNPNIWAEYFQLMWAHFALKQYPQAREWAEKAAAANSKNPTMPLMLAALDVIDGNPPAAKGHIAEALALAPALTIKGLRAQIGSQEPFFNKMADRFYDALKQAGLPE